MPIKLTDAQAAVTALTGSGASLFDALKKNATAHDQSHLSKAKAAAAIAGGKPTCGYYYKSSSETYFVSAADATVEKERLGKKDKKSQWQRKTRSIELPIGLQEMADLCYTALITYACILAEGSTATRFIRIAAFKAGYGGNTLRASGITACAGVAVVVQAGAGVSPQIVTHFPIDQAAIDAAKVLV